MIEKLGTKWTEKDFEIMGWHDNFIESIIFPSENLVLSIQLNYLLEWIKPSDQKFYKFKVALARLDFYSVLHLSIHLDFGNITGLYIEDILRDNRRLTPNRKSYQWDYTIQTDQGNITFDASGFTQTLISDPKISDSLRYSDI